MNTKKLNKTETFVYLKKKEAKSFLLIQGDHLIIMDSVLRKSISLYISESH